MKNSIYVSKLKNKGYEINFSTYISNKVEKECIKKDFKVLVRNNLNRSPELLELFDILF